MSEACPYCDYSETHHTLCPMTSILADPDRYAAYCLMREETPACSDWVDSAMNALEHVPATVEAHRELLSEAFSLHQQWLDRVTLAAVRAAIS